MGGRTWYDLWAGQRGKDRERERSIHDVKKNNEGFNSATVYSFDVL